MVEWNMTTNRQGNCIKEKEIQEIRDFAIESKTRFEYIQKDLSDIRVNHIAHMVLSLENMNKKLGEGFEPLEHRVAKLEKLANKVLAWAAVLAIIAGILIQLLFKYL